MSHGVTRIRPLTFGSVFREPRKNTALDASVRSIPRARVGFWLFVTSACFFLLGTAGHIYTPDGVIMFQVTQSLVDRGGTSIAGLREWPGFGGTPAPGPNGTSAFYAKYGPGLSLAAV